MSLINSVCELKRRTPGRTEQSLGFLAKRFRDLKTYDSDKLKLMNDYISDNFKSSYIRLNILRGNYLGDNYRARGKFLPEDWYIDYVDALEYFDSMDFRVPVAIDTIMGDIKRALDEITKELTEDRCSDKEDASANISNLLHFVEWEELLASSYASWEELLDISPIAFGDIDSHEMTRLHQFPRYIKPSQFREIFRHRCIVAQLLLNEAHRGHDERETIQLSYDILVEFMKLNNILKQALLIYFN